MANPTAVELVKRPELGITPLTRITGNKKGYTSDELAIFHIGEDDIEQLFIKIHGYTKKTTKLNFRDHVLDAAFEDSIDKTPTFTMTIHDPDWDLLNSGALDKQIDLNPGKIPHRWYRLDSFSVNDDDLSLVFATRNAVYLSGHKRPYKISRNKVTRAQFILTLLHHVKVAKISMYCPQLKKKQKIAKFTASQRTHKDENRDSGFTKSDKITVKHVTASEPQRKVISDVIEAGKDIGAPGMLIVAAVMTVIQESGASNNPQPPNPPYIGCFQQNRADGWPGTGDAYKDAIGNKQQGVKQGGFYGWGLPIYQKDPNRDLGAFIAESQGVVGSTNPLNAGYAQSVDRWRDEAQHAVNAYGGITVDDPGSATSTSTDFRKAYEFGVGEPAGNKGENYLAAMYRLANEVNWRAYWVRDVLHYMSEEDLFKAQARTRLRRFEDGVEHISFSWDRMRKVNTMTVQVRMDRWVCPVGTVVVVDGAGPASGRWLVTNIRRSMFSTLGEIELHKPMKEKLEPTAPRGTKTTEVAAAGGGSTSLGDDDPGDGPVDHVGDLTYPLGIRGTFIGGMAAHAGRAWGDWQSDRAVDIGCPMGTNIYAVDDGVITKLGGHWDGTGASNPNGWNITLTTATNAWFYTHLKFRTAGCQVGQKVSAGQYFGKSGAANGVPHLHIGCQYGDPQKLLGW